MKFLKSNILIFFILGLFLAKLLSANANWNNFQGEGAQKAWYLHIILTLEYFIPFFIAIILNLIIKFSKSEKVQKVFKTIMKITNVLSVMYLLYLLFIQYVVSCMFGECGTIWQFLFN